MNNTPETNWPGSDRYKGGVVRGVELSLLHLPFKTEFKIAAGGPRPGIDVMVVKIHTESGQSPESVTPRAGALNMAAVICRSVEPV